MAIYFVAKTIQQNHPDQGKQVGNYTAKEEFAPIFYALCGELNKFFEKSVFYKYHPGLHCILALNMACAYRDAFHEMVRFLC